MEIYNGSLYLFSVNILPMVETVLQNHDAPRSPDKIAVSFQHLESGENITCNHLGIYRN